MHAMHCLNKPLVVIFLGPPGAGKGTHAVPLSHELGIPHISTGDLFRGHIRGQSSLGLKVKHYLDQGNFVPDELVLEMLFDRIDQLDCKNGYILDGFPRTLLQAQVLDRRIKNQSRIVALNFYLPDATIVERLTGRITCKECGYPHHKKYDPPVKEMICNVCGGALFQRDDDREEIIRKRLEIYCIQTQPLVDYYAKQKGVLCEIDSQKEKGLVFQRILEALPEASSLALARAPSMWGKM